MSTPRTVGVVSPGAMGSAVADALAAGGSRVVASVSGRSERTARLAERAEVDVLPELEAVVGAAHVVLSIVPPEAAPSVAENVAAAALGARAQPLFVDLNAIGPSTALRIEATVASAGLQLVDGSISGPPPRTAGTTRIYLSGERAEDVAALPMPGVDRVVVGPRVGTASAVKMSTASVYKGTSALLLQALRAAEANDVLEHVLADLRIGAPELVARIDQRLAMAASKSGRYVGEMREIAAAQRETGLSPVLFEAMAEIYAAVSKSPLGDSGPEEIPTGLGLKYVLDRLR